MACVQHHCRLVLKCSQRALARPNLRLFHRPLLAIGPSSSAPWASPLVANPRSSLCVAVLLSANQIDGTSLALALSESEEVFAQLRCAACFAMIRCDFELRVSLLFVPMSRDLDQLCCLCLLQVCNCTSACSNDALLLCVGYVAVRRRCRWSAAASPPRKR